MENQHKSTTPQQDAQPDIQEEMLPPQEKYIPRPLWQIILAWLGLGLIVGLLILQFALMLKGGL